MVGVAVKILLREWVPGSSQLTSRGLDSDELPSGNNPREAFCKGMMLTLLLEEEEQQQDLVGWAGELLVYT